MNSFIYDFETLSPHPETGVILSVAMTAFDTERFNSKIPYTFEELIEKAYFYKYDVAEQKEKFNRTVDADTLKWWKEQSPDAIQSQVMPSQFDVSISLMPQQFKNAIPNNKKFKAYCRGLTFDPMFLRAVCEQLDQPFPYGWWAERDTRSLFDGFLWGTGFNNTFNPYEEEMKDLPLHDPRVDIALDIMRFQYIVQKISG